MDLKQSNILDPGLVFPLRLHNLDGNTFMSGYARGQLCTACGTGWRVDGRYFDGVDDYIILNNTFSAVSGSAGKTIITRANPGKIDFSTESNISPAWYNWYRSLRNPRTC